jgi:hypothetical protein
MTGGRFVSLLPNVKRTEARVYVQPFKRFGGQANRELRLDVGLPTLAPVEVSDLYIDVTSVEQNDGR